MFTFFAKPTRIVFTMIAFTACGAADHESNLDTVGGPKILVTCSDQGSKFIIRDTAAVNIKQGVLTTKDGNSFFTCKEAAKKPGPVIPDQSKALYNCDESSTGRSFKHVKVERLGLAPVTLAYVTLDQMFPLQPKLIATLTCK